MIVSRAAEPLGIDAASAKSSTGTISGGSLTIRGSRHEMAQLLEGLEAVVRASLADRTPDTRSQLGSRSDWNRGTSRRRRGGRTRPRASAAAKLPHRLAVGAGGPPHERRSLPSCEPVVTAGDLEARGQPLHVPLPRSGRGLVEVVHVEEEVALGRSEEPKFDEVGVAAELDLQPELGADADPRPSEAPRPGSSERRHDIRPWRIGTSSDHASSPDSRGSRPGRRPAAGSQAA